MEFKQNEYMQMSMAELACALCHIAPYRLHMMFNLLCKAAITDYIMATQGDFTFRRGDRLFQPKNAWEGRFWRNMRQSQKDLFLKRNFRGKQLPE